jgi:aryl-alcohol dehydrogenase-like predicted oxidoreductase
MHYRPLGNTKVKVSSICLGTMTWGEQNTRDEAFAQMDYALENGVNFFDAAEIYPVPPIKETQGRTESYIGDWFKARKNRDKVILATKVAGRSDYFTYLRDEAICLNRRNIEQALNASLQRLQTDYIDLYQLHWPDRPTNYFGQLGYTHSDEAFVPLEDTLRALGDAVQAGKIRHIGVSNETPWGVMRFLSLAQELGLPRMVSVQNPYNLLNRSYEVGLAEVSIREQCGLLAYSPLGFGVLTGKYLNNAKPEKARLTLFNRFTRYTSAKAQKITESYVAIARKHGLDPAVMALAFVNQQPFVTSNIIGATTLEQLKTNISSGDVLLNETILAEINAVHNESPNPCP